MALWLALTAVLAGAPALGEGVPAGPAMQWTFSSNEEGWRVGASPIQYYTEGDGPDATRAASIAGGAVAVRGVPTERLFMDEGGLVRRGATVMQWLLSPELGVEATQCQSLAVRLRARTGSDLNWRVQWLTESGRAAYAAHRSADSRMALPDSVYMVFDAYRRGEVEDDVWQRFMGAWEGGEGHEYALAAKRLREEEILLRGWMETESWRMSGNGEWQEVGVDLGAMAGWRGKVIALGLELILQPSAPEVLGGPPHSTQDPFVWVDRVELCGVAGP